MSTMLEELKRRRNVRRAHLEAVKCDLRRWDESREKMVDRKVELEVELEELRNIFEKLGET